MKPIMPMRNMGENHKQRLLVKVRGTTANAVARKDGISPARVKCACTPGHLIFA